MHPTARAERTLSCTQCGWPEAHAVGNELLCAACCHARGSCGATSEAPDSDDVPAALPPRLNDSP